jgi:hypothetical protein
MNHSVFIQVIDRFNTGQVIFNRGRNWSFLFYQKWYPVNALCRRKSVGIVRVVRM